LPHCRIELADDQDSAHQSREDVADRAACELIEALASIFRDLELVT
jgi:hypothetical protein